MRSTAEVMVPTGSVAGTCEIDGVPAEYQTTPPLPASSSPGMDIDISPLPMYKGAYVAQVEIHSPTPVTSSGDDDEDMILESPAPIARRSSAETQKLAESVQLQTCGLDVQLTSP